MVRLLGFLTAGTHGQCGLGQMIVRPARTGAPLGMSPFWIRHGTTPFLVPRVVSSIAAHTYRRGLYGLYARKPIVFSASPV